MILALAASASFVLKMLAPTTESGPSLSMSTASAPNLFTVTAPSFIFASSTASVPSLAVVMAPSIISVVLTEPVTATVGTAPAFSAARVMLPLEKSCPFWTVTVKLISI